MTDIQERARENFVKDTAEHELTVLRDDGLYRHLRCRKPGTVIYGFDLVTWPGYLAIVGDTGDYVFSRVEDMLEFFEASRGSINPPYWSEKLQAPKYNAENVSSYSWRVYERRVKQWLDEVCAELSDAEADALRLAATNDLLDEYGGWRHSSHDAGSALLDFEHEGIRIHDAWEWDLNDWDYSFLWCCHAIVWGIEQYREHEASNSQRNWAARVLQALRANRATPTARRAR